VLCIQCVFPALGGMWTGYSQSTYLMKHNLVLKALDVQQTEFMSSQQTILSVCDMKIVTAVSKPYSLIYARIFICLFIV
jgi:hypothetical protein